MKLARLKGHQKYALRVTNSPRNHCTLALWNRGTVKPWSCCTLAFLNCWTVKPWSCCTLALWNRGTVESWSHCTLAFLNRWTVKPWSCCTLALWNHWTIAPMHCGTMEPLQLSIVIPCNRGTKAPSSSYASARGLSRWTLNCVCSSSLFQKPISVFTVFYLHYV